MSEDAKKCSKAMYFLLDGSSSVLPVVDESDWGDRSETPNFLTKQLQTAAGLLKNQEFVEKQLEGGPLLVAVGTFANDHVPRMGWQKIESFRDAQRVAGMIEGLIGRSAGGGTWLGKGLVGATAQFYNEDMPYDLQVDLANASRSIHVVTDGRIAKVDSHPDQLDKAGQRLQQAIAASRDAIAGHAINVNTILIGESFDAKSQSQKALAASQLQAVAQAGRGRYSEANWDNFAENVRKDLKCNLLLSELEPMIQPVNGHVSRADARQAIGVMKAHCPIDGVESEIAAGNLEVMQDVAALLEAEQRAALFSEATDIDLAAGKRGRG